MNHQNFVIGVDYGTDSVRAVIVNALTGEEVASSVFLYPRWEKGLYCNAAASQFRQHPLDYIEGLEATITNVLKKAGSTIASAIRAISIDTTGSTPVAVNQNGTPLALLPGFEENANAMFVLWKDHTAINEATEINTHAEKFETNYLQFVGGIYSSEWYWAKLLHILRTDEAIRNGIYLWVEHCDWIPFLLTGGTQAAEIKVGVCSAGHKALWAEEFGGYPPEEFFTSLDPLLAGIRSKLPEKTYTASEKAGTLSSEWADKLGLSTNVIIGIGALDAHVGAVGGQIQPYYLSKVMGTSTCDMLIAPMHPKKNRLISGICGQVNGSIIPGMIGLEAGQSAFGDAFAWLKEVLAWPLKNLLSNSQIIDAETRDKLVAEIEAQIIPQLSIRAKLLPVEEDAEFAVEWLNGRRSPDADQLLRAAFLGLDLGTDAVKMFRSLVEATCFGAKKIIERFTDQGISVKGLIGLGGVARKSPFIMQVMADVLDMPIKIHRSDQTSAIGAAMFAATVAGIYPKVEDAMLAMGQGFDTEYFPDPKRAIIYAKRYKRYCEIGTSISLLSKRAKHTSI